MKLESVHLSMKNSDHAVKHEFYNNFYVRRHKVTAKRKVSSDEDDDSGGFRLKKMKTNMPENLGSSISTSCHQCKTSNCGRIIRCNKCKKKNYCARCALKWYPGMSEDVMSKACPFCCNNCNCTFCLEHPNNLDNLMLELTEDEKLTYSKHIIHKLLPFLKRFSEEQMKEKDIEAKIQGKPVTEIKLERANCMDADDIIYCNNCKTSIADFHWSCSDCSYELCITCCQELRKGCTQGAKEKVTKLNTGDGPGFSYEGGRSNFCNNVELQMENSLKKSVRTVMWKPMENGKIPCLSTNSCFGTVQLKCIYPENWVTELVLKAEEISQTFGPKPQPDSPKSKCSCNEKNAIHKAASREDSEDNYLCCLKTVNIKGEDLSHFLRHLSRGEPVIVNDVLDNTSRLSWDPMVIWRVWRRTKTDVGSSQDVDVIDCLSECQVNMNSFDFFKGYTEGRYDSNGRRRLLKLYNWPYSDTFEERFPRHVAEFISCLPFMEVTHPRTGYLNLAAKLPEESSKPDLGPNIYIAYGFPHELRLGDSVMKLQCATADVVNVLLHSEAVTAALTPEQLLAIKKDKQEQIPQSPTKSSKDNGRENLPSNRFEGPPGFNNTKFYGSPIPIKLEFEKNMNLWKSYNNNVGQNEGQQNRTHPISATSSRRCDDEEAGVLWDIFRRQDIPKLMEYLNLHFREFTHTFCAALEQVCHPIHDQTIYLSTDHKRRLKEEYGIEPWTFTQKLGNAVIIPAGCPYQIRNLKSCVSVALDFISPESVDEAIRLTEEFRDLPEDHIAKEDRLEVKKLILHSVSSAIKDFEKFSKLDNVIYIEDSSSMSSLVKEEGETISSRRKHTRSSSPISDEVSFASSQEDNLTIPPTYPISQPLEAPCSKSECQNFSSKSCYDEQKDEPYETKNVEKERVESALNKLQALSSAKRNHLLDNSKSGDASKNSSLVMLAKEIFDDFIEFPQEVFGNLSDEVTTMDAISVLIENLPSFEKEAKLILETKEMLSSIVLERRMKEKLQRKYQEELSELEEYGNNIDNLVNSVTNMKVKYDEFLLQEHELEKQKQEIEHKLVSISAKRKSLGNKIEEESVRAEVVIAVSADKETKAKSDKQKMAVADSVIDSVMSRFYAVRSQYNRHQQLF